MVKFLILLILKETKIFAKGAKAQTLPALVELVELIASKKNNQLN